MTAPDLFWTLWTTSWQAGAMAGAVWLACRPWPRMPANLRVMLWWLVSLKFVIGLVWTQPIPLPVLPAVDDTSGSISSMGSIRSIERSSSIGSGSIAPAFDNGRSSTANDVLAAAVGFWLLGVIAQGALLIRQLVRTRQLIASALPVEGDAAELFDELVARLGVAARQPRLRVSTAIGTPQVTGLLRPVILLPVDALETFSTRELSLTLCHELMHVKRLDLWHGWVPSVAARLFFFHPLARLAGREYAIAREAACDAAVLAFMDAAAYDYGRLLMRLGITAREAAPAAAGAAPTLHTLKRRLLMLHDASPHTRGLSPRWWALAAIAAMLVIPMRPTAAQRQQPPNPPNAQSAANMPNEPQGESWVFMQDDDNSAMHGSSDDFAEAKRQRVNASEPMIWFRRDGRAYVIRDRETLDKARALFLQQEQLQKTMHVLEERQMLLRAQQDDLGRQYDGMRAQLRDVDRMVDEASAELQKTVPPPARQSEADRQKVTDELLRREIRLAEVQARRREVATHQEVLAAQQRALGEHQFAQGAEQAALGRQMEQMGHEIEREMRTLFDSALAAGVATTVK